jgi:hypothetical protein
VLAEFALADAALLELASVIAAAPIASAMPAAMGVVSLLLLATLSLRVIVVTPSLSVRVGDLNMRLGRNVLV